MGIRETINQHKGATMGAASGVIVLALLLIILQASGGGASGSSGGKSQLFFTIDDGKTWFKDDATKVPPYMKDGKEAIRAYVYRSGDGTEFVGSMERYTPAGKKALEAGLARPAEEQAMDDPYLAVESARQVKKPGESSWVSINDPRAAAVQDVVSPKGKSDTVTSVSPQ